MADGGRGLAMLRRAVDRGTSPSLEKRLLPVLEGDDTAGVHLAIFVEPFLQAVLDGRKTVESRFGLTRCSPFGQVAEGDVILLKRSGGPVVGLAMAGTSQYHELSPVLLAELRERYASRLYAEDDDFWAAREGKRYASLIEIALSAEIKPMVVDKRDRRGWVTLTQPRQACLSLPS